MPLNPTTLEAAIKSALAPLGPALIAASQSSEAVPQSLWTDIANAIADKVSSAVASTVISHITTNATVATTCDAGPGTGVIS